MRAWRELGLHPGGVLGLWWGDVDLAEGTIRIRRSRLAVPGPPGSGWRTIGLPPQIVTLLHEYGAWLAMRDGQS